MKVLIVLQMKVLIVLHKDQMFHKAHKLHAEIPLILDPLKDKCSVNTYICNTRFYTSW